MVSKVIAQMTPTKQREIIDRVKVEKRKRVVAMNFSEQKKRKDALSDDHIKAIQSFYEQDDISRMCPGKKETKSVKTASRRVLKQKRYLIMNVNEAHQVYKQTTALKIGRSKFAELRPEHVLVINDKDQNVCMCQYHENLSMLLTGIAKMLTRLQNCTADAVVKSICCMLDDDHISCIDLECGDCGSVKYLDTIIPENSNTLNQLVVYYQWATNKNGHMTKKPITSDLADAKEQLVMQLGMFCKTCVQYVATTSRDEIHERDARE